MKHDFHYDVKRDGNYLLYETEYANNMKFENPIFNQDDCNDKEIGIHIITKENEAKFFKQEMEGNIGFLFGVKNISNKKIKIKLYLEGLFNINPKEWDYKNKTLHKYHLNEGNEKFIGARKILEWENEIKFDFDIDSDKDENKQK